MREATNLCSASRTGIMKSSLRTIRDCSRVDNRGSTGLLLAGLVLLLWFEIDPSLAQTVNRNGPELILQSGHGNVVSSVAYSPNGRWLASGSGDTTIRLWDVGTGRSFRTLTGHTGPVTNVVFSRDGRWLASASFDRTVKLWDVVTWHEMRSMSDHIRAAYALAFSRDSRWLASGDAKRVMVWEAATGNKRYILSGHTDTVVAVAFSPDGRLLASASSDRTVKLWDMSTGTEKRTLGHKEIVNTVTFSPDGQWLASSGGDEPYDEAGKERTDTDYTVKIWEAATGHLLRTLSGHTDMVHSLAFSPDGHRLASGGGSRFFKPRPGTEVILWEVTTGRILRQFPSFEMEVYTVAFSPDGISLAAGSWDGVKIWEVESGRIKRTLRRRTNWVRRVAYSPDNKWIAIGGGDNVQLWDVTTGRELRPLGNQLGSLSAMTFSNNGHWLAAYTYLNSPKVRVWEVNSACELHTFDLPGGSEGAVALTPDARTLAAASGDSYFKAIHIWDTTTGHELRTLTGHVKSFTSLAFSPDGRWLASGDDEKKIELWDVLTGHQRRSLTGHTYGVSDVAFSPDGRQLASASWDRTVKLWDVASGKIVRTLARHTAGVEAIAFSRDGRLLASASVDRTLRLWDLKTGSELELKTLVGHTDRVRSVGFSPDGRLIVSGSEDNSLRLWDASTGAELALLSSMQDGGWAVVTPDGLFDGTADALQRISWRVGITDETVPLDSFFNDFYYPNLLSELTQGNRPRARVDISTALQIPSLRTMLSQGLARIEKRDGKQTLCFYERPTVSLQAPQFSSDAQSIAFDPNDLTFYGEDAVCPWRKELPGDKQYELISTSSPLKAEVKLTYDGTKSETAESTLHILTVAVDSYDLSSSGFKPLLSSVRGAKEVEGFFAQQKGITNKPYRTIRIWDALYDAAATRDAIRQRLASMAREVEEDDVVFLFFSGHGIVPAGQEMFYFAPIDMRGPNPQDQRETGLNTAMLAEAIREMPARRVVLIIDACQSGGAIESLAKIGEVKAKVEMRRAQTEERAGTNGHKHEVGIYIIAAATPLQEAVQPKSGNGALVATLLEGLRSERAPVTGEEIWIRELIKHIQQRLPEVSAQIGQRHTPMIVSTGVDFSIAKK